MSTGSRALVRAIGVVDRMVPKRAAIVLRTGRAPDDQGRELVKALRQVTERPITYLVDEVPHPDPDPPFGCEVVSARSPAGLWAYWRARVVVHTHGVFGSIRGSGRKTFVNIWHGMPIKRLEAGSSVGAHQTDLTIATSPIHATNLASTWALDPSQVAITGLPRNDILLEGNDKPDQLAALTHGRPLVLWLPTFRGSPRRGGAVDGRDAGTPSQLDGGTAEAIDAVMARLGLHALIKPHPLAPAPERAHLAHLDVWSEADLEGSGLGLYELLAHADHLITDHSSVWIDYLLLQRPIVFAISDEEEYSRSRGFYFASLEDLLPGPMVTDLRGVERELGAFVAGHDEWAAARREALTLHHTHTEGGSAARVAEVVVAALEPSVVT